MGDKSKIAFKEIPGHPRYYASSDGMIWSAWKRKSLGYGGGTKMVLGQTSKRLKPCMSTGYPVVHLGRKARQKIAALVLLAFVGPRPKGMECRHLDGNPLNSKLENLCWGTSTQNTDDQRRHGTLIGGERHGMAKLTNDRVRQIRDIGRTMPQAKIASLFGISQSTVSEILTGKRRTESSHAGRGL